MKIIGHFAGGFSPDQVDEIEDKKKIKAINRKKEIARIRKDTTNHIILQNALKAFESIEDSHTPITVSPLEDTYHNLLTDPNDENFLEMKIVSCLKSSVKIEISGFYKKSKWIKGPNFHIDKQTVQVEESQKIEEIIRVRYGDFFEFQSNLFKGINSIIKSSQIDDPTKEKLALENIWEFKFQ